MLDSAPRDLHASLAELRRPKLLVQAARFGLEDYNRRRDLPRLTGLSGPPPGAAEVVSRLLAREAELDAARRAGDAGYSYARHIDLLIALMGEARLLGPSAMARLSAT